MNFGINILNISSKPNSSKVLSFGSEKAARNPLEIPEQYTSQESKDRTVAILGASKDTEYLNEITKKTFLISKELVRRGYKILTGCGDRGIMGAAYKGASSAEKDPEKPENNLAVLVEPLWGDEDTQHSKVIAKPATSESDRIENGFLKASNNFLIFPGGATSIQEASTFIAKNKYKPKCSTPLNIKLVGKEYYNGLKQQYDDMYNAGILGTEPDNLFKVVDAEDILKDFPDLKHSD